MQSNHQQLVESLLLNNNNPVQKSTRLDAMTLMLGYQQSIAQQQLLFKLLLLQNQHSRQEYPKKEANVIIKAEPSAFNTTLSCRFQKTPLAFPNSISKLIINEENNKESKNPAKTIIEEIPETNIIVKREQTCETQFSLSDDLLAKCAPVSEPSTTMEESGSDAESEGKIECKIRRRNGFKTPKHMSEDHDDISEEYIRKSNKMIIPKRPPSKAKHLWINYGRKIIEFAVNHTKDDVQIRIKQLIGRLSSKKDFEDVFGIQTDDSESEKAFKVSFGKLALFFIKFKSDIAFEGSKYREQMVTQKSVVASWISKLINESN